MAVTQISKIQIRRGLQENLPQLASAELGWSIDEQRLFIGNGTLAEGAPTVGMTEILTTQTIYSELALIEALQGNVANMTANITSIQSELNSLEANVGVYTTAFLNNQVTAVNTAITFDSLSSRTIDYTIVRGATSRVGTLKVTELLGTSVYEDDYVETVNTGVTLGFVSNGNSAIMTYTTTNFVPPTDAVFSYYIKPFI
jgi:hypothetical protein